MSTVPGSTESGPPKEGTLLSRAMRPVNNVVDRYIPSSPVFSIILTFIVVLLAREVAYQGRQRGMKLHFPMLVASGFAGFVIWHMGYSGSGALTAATPGSFLTESLGGQTVPTTIGLLVIVSL